MAQAKINPPANHPFKRGTDVSLQFDRPEVGAVEFMRIACPKRSVGHLSMQVCRPGIVLFADRLMALAPDLCKTLVAAFLKSRHR